jgi:hypothetical protein
MEFVKGQRSSGESSVQLNSNSEVDCHTYQSSHRNIYQNVYRTIIDDRGSVESGLVLIPLVVIFLVTAQLVVAGNWINAQVTQHHTLINREAILGKNKTDGSGARSDSSDRITYQPLIGGGYIVISERKQELPLISNFASVIPGFSSGVITLTHKSTSLSEVFSD